MLKDILLFLKIKPGSKCHQPQFELEKSLLYPCFCFLLLPHLFVSMIRAKRDCRYKTLYFLSTPKYRQHFALSLLLSVLVTSSSGSSDWFESESYSIAEDVRSQKPEQKRKVNLLPWFKCQHYKGQAIVNCLQTVPGLLSLHSFSF